MVASARLKRAVSSPTSAEACRRPSADLWIKSERTELRGAAGCPRYTRNARCPGTPRHPRTPSERQAGGPQRTSGPLREGASIRMGLAADYGRPSVESMRKEVAFVQELSAYVRAPVPPGRRVTGATRRLTELCRTPGRVVEAEIRGAGCPSGPGYLVNSGRPSRSLGKARLGGESAGRVSTKPRKPLKNLTVSSRSRLSLSCLSPYHRGRERLRR